MEKRREFLKATGTGLLGAAADKNFFGANERVRVGFIGIGLIGKRHLLDFMAQSDVEIAAICELYQPRLDEGVATADGKPAAYKDFRMMLERKDLDAVVVSTPDHWHALMTIMACASGKDVYVEKPLTHVAREGQWMVAAARYNKRVVQVGTQQRSGEQYKECVELIRTKHIGTARCSDLILPKYHARVHRSCRYRTPLRRGLENVAWTGTLCSLRQEPRHISFPLVLGLLRGANYKPLVS